MSTVYGRTNNIFVNQANYLLCSFYIYASVLRIVLACVIKVTNKIHNHSDVNFHSTGQYHTLSAVTLKPTLKSD